MAEWICEGDTASGLAAGHETTGARRPGRAQPEGPRMGIADALALAVALKNTAGSTVSATQSRGAREGSCDVSDIGHYYDW